MIARVQPLKDRGDRDGIRDWIVAPIELASEVEDRLRRERILPRRVVLDDPAAGRRARERLTLWILERGEPLHVGQAVAHGLEAVLEGECADGGREPQIGDIVRRTFQQTAAAERPLEAIRVDACAALEARIRGERHLRRVDVRARLPRREERASGLRAAGRLRDRDIGCSRRGGRGRSRVPSRTPVRAAEEDPERHQREDEGERHETGLRHALRAGVPHRGDNPRIPMDDLRPITPIRRPLVDKRVQVPASKSVSNREIVLSAIADGRSRLQLGPLDPGDDVRAMTEAVIALDYRVERDDGELVIQGTGAGPHRAGGAVDARDAGTVARFGAALAALGSGYVTITGSPRLRERPIAPLLDALRRLGATVKGDRLPVTIVGPIRSGEIEIAGNESSQFASALLLVAPRLDGGLRLEILGTLVSAPFVDLTIASLRRRGVKIEREGNLITVEQGKVRARNLRIPGDVTAATYPAAAAAVLGGAVTIDGVDARVRPGNQGDARFFELLEAMGCGVFHRGGGVRVSRIGELHGIRANVKDCSDVFPTLAVVATQASEATELTGIGHTRKQESDRVKVVANGINALGGRAQAFADAIRVEPAPMHDGIIDACADHRVAMAFSVLGLQVPGVAIKGAGSVAKTFPQFYEMLAELSR